MPLGRTKFVAMLLLTLIAVGLCVPETCADEIWSLPSPADRVSAPNDEQSSSPYTCEFEEDCFCCAHVAPVARFALSAAPWIAFQSLEAASSELMRELKPPYYPPRG
jgi:hypothetical protein